MFIFGNENKLLISATYVLGDVAYSDAQAKYISYQIFVIHLKRPKNLYFVKKKKKKEHDDQMCHMGRWRKVAQCRQYILAPFFIVK